jgi:hypothetical protein
MTAFSLNLPDAVPASKAALPRPVRILRRALMTSRATVPGLIRSFTPTTAIPLPVGMAGAAIPAPEGVNVIAFRRIRMSGVARYPVAPRCLPLPVHGLGDRLQAGERVTAQNVQAAIKVIEDQPWRNRAAEELPGHPVHPKMLAVMTTATDLAVSGAARRAAPDPVPVHVGQLVEDPVDGWPPGVLSWHACILYPTLSVRKGNG